MTDKQLKQLLHDTPRPEDEQFVQRVMEQLPDTSINWRPIWGIRIVSIIAALIALWALKTESLSDFFYQILSLLSQQPSFSVMLTGSLLIALATLWLCHNRGVV